MNLGTMERTRVSDAVREVLRYTGHNAEVRLMPDMPTGPLNRVAEFVRRRPGEKSGTRSLTAVANLSTCLEALCR